MPDLFKDKAQEWDARPLPTQISEGVVGKLLEIALPTSEMRVLDFGAGTGLLCAKLAPRVKRLLAVDISEAMLDQLRQKPELQDKVEIYCQDLLSAPLAQRVELVVSAMALHHVKETPALLATLFAHLEPGGRIALADLDAEDGDFHPPGTEGVYHHGFARDALTELAEAAGFTEIRFDTACELDREGKRYPVFLLTAKRPV